jgi:hypothetical protein
MTKEYEHKAAQVALFEVYPSGRQAICPTAYANPDGTVDDGPDKQALEAGRAAGKTYRKRDL